MAKDKEATTSDFNLRRLNMGDLAIHLRASIQAGSNVAIFGRRGSGKTEISKQQIAACGAKEVYINLSVLERVDMGGYPDILNANRKKSFVDFLLPHFYESMIEGDAPVVALLDEADKVDPSVWAPLLEFTQFKSINGRQLPNLQSIIMTGNLISEGGARPSLPLLDRTEKYLVQPDLESWFAWAGKSGRIHPSVSAYITDHPGDLFGPEDADDRYADPSPRGWENASRLLFKGEKHKWDKEVMHTKVAGCIGKAVGVKYQSYFEHYMELLPLVEQIYRGNDVRKEYSAMEPSKKLVTCMIACARLATMLDNKKATDDVITNVGKFLGSKSVSFENILVSIRSQLTLDRLMENNIDTHAAWEPTLDQLNKKMS